MWAHYDIFANANKNLKKASAGAKDLKKQLAGFDEMNVLSDSGGGGGATAMNLPSVMISEPEYQQTLTSQSDTDTLANAIGDAIGGQRVYVVESDIQNANNKSNKRKTEVTF
jgi:hypothetical protein